MLNYAYIVDYCRTPFLRRPTRDSSAELASQIIAALVSRNPQLGRESIEDVILGSAYGGGNVARDAALLAGLSPIVPGATVNRSCASGLEAVACAARKIAAGEAELVLAGGVETAGPSAASALDPGLHDKYGNRSLPETSECVADEYAVSRADQDAYALRSHERAAAAQRDGRLAKEIFSSQKDDLTQAASLRALSQMPTPFRKNGTVTQENRAQEANGAAALLIASEKALETYGFIPLARVAGVATAAVPPRIAGMAAVPAALKLLDRLDVPMDHFDLIELHEASAADSLAALRSLRLADDAAHVNRNGGAIALGHPAGASGVRLAGTAALRLQSGQAQHALVMMGARGGLGLAMALDRM